jgi:hypothetical protein
MVTAWILSLLFILQYTSRSVLSSLFRVSSIVVDSATRHVTEYLYMLDRA